METIIEAATPEGIAADQRVTDGKTKVMHAGNVAAAAGQSFSGRGPGDEAPEEEAKATEEDTSSTRAEAASATILSFATSRACCIRVRALPLPEPVTRFLQEHTHEINLIADVAAHTRRAASTAVTSDDSEAVAASDAPADESSGSSKAAPVGLQHLSDVARRHVEQFLEGLEALLSQQSDPTWRQILSNIWSFGPKRCGPNILASRLPESTAADRSDCIPSVWEAAGLHEWQTRFATATDAAACGDTPAGALKRKGYFDVALQRDEINSEVLTRMRPLRSAIVSGFQMATAAGPLCAEPVWGVCFVLEDIYFRDTPQWGPAPIWGGVDSTATSAASGSDTASVTGAGAGSFDPMVDVFGPLSGQVMGCMKDGCTAAMQAGSMRLVEQMYKCELQCSGGRTGGGEQLGKLYAVLGQRRGQVLDEQLLEGTETFVIEAYLPVVESFGFATDLRTRTSGAATSPQLVFDHWQVLPVDPFFQPKTEEEREEFGETLADGQMVNIAKQYIDQVRRRKGLALDRKIVVHAEKQRNLSKKK